MEQQCEKADAVSLTDRIEPMLEVFHTGFPWRAAQERKWVWSHADLAWLSLVEEPMGVEKELTAAHVARQTRFQKTDVAVGRYHQRRSPSARGHPSRRCSLSTCYLGDE